MSLPFSAEDHAHMAEALRLAELGLETTTPNPRVGCVIVRDGKVVGRGWHARAGADHAEVEALRAAGAMSAGATAYVTLEPCRHHGRTPACTNALLAAGVRRVVAAAVDPDPRNAGMGLEQLTSAGVEVHSGLMRVWSERLNCGFVKRNLRSLPWVRLKVAGSTDGRTALADGQSRWITGPAARRDVHRWRARSCAVLTGSGTALADDPQLDVRALACTRQPLRVLVDGSLRVPRTARLFSGPPIVVAHICEQIEPDLVGGPGIATYWRLPDEHGHVALKPLLHRLADNGINEVLVEAGPVLSGALVRQGLVDEFLIYTAPLLLGSSAQGMLELGRLTKLDDGPVLDVTDVRFVGQDLRIQAYPRSSSL